MSTEWKWEACSKAYSYVEKDMPYISSFEVKLIASYLLKSIDLTTDFPEKPKLGKLLDAISKSQGFRDWNAMKAIVPDTPETERGNWCTSFFSIACALDEAQNLTFHFDWFRDSEVARHDSAIRLARLVTKNSAIKSQNIGFTYSQPDHDDYYDADEWGPAPPNDENKPSLCLSAPVIAISDDKNTKVFLWWLNHTYTVSEEFSKRVGKFSSQSINLEDYDPLSFEASSTFNPLPLTVTFLTEMTGLTPPTRKCFYITQLPNGSDDSYVPVIVEEGSQNVVLFDLNLGTDRDTAIELVRKQNMERGVSASDSRSISRKFRSLEPQEDIYVDDFF